MSSISGMPSWAYDKDQYQNPAIEPQQAAQTPQPDYGMPDWAYDKDTTPSTKAYGMPDWAYDKEQMDAAETIAKPTYFLERAIKQAVEIPEQDRPAFLETLKRKAIEQRELNKDRGTLGGMWDSFKEARNQAGLAVERFADTLGAGFTKDEDWEYVNEILSIRSGYTNPGNQGWFQKGAEGAARLVPDVIAGVAIGTAGSVGTTPLGGALAAGSYMFARTAPEIEGELNRYDVDKSISKPLALIASGPIAALEFMHLGALSAPLKTAFVKSVQKIGAEAAIKVTGKLGQHGAAQASGRFASDYASNMLEEAAQSVAEGATVVLGKTLQDGGYSKEAAQAFQEQYREKLDGLYEAALPMGMLIGGSRAISGVANLRKGNYVDNLKEEEKANIVGAIVSKPELIDRIANSEDAPSRKDMQELGIYSPTSIGDRKALKAELITIQTTLKSQEGQGLFDESQGDPRVSEQGLIQGPEPGVNPTDQGDPALDGADIPQSDIYVSEEDFSPDEELNDDFDAFTYEYEIERTALAEEVRKEKEDAKQRFDAAVSEIEPIVLEMEPGKINEIMDQANIGTFEIDKLKGDEKVAAKRAVVLEYLTERKLLADKLGISEADFDREVEAQWKAKIANESDDPTIKEVEDYIKRPKTLLGGEVMPHGLDPTNMTFIELKEAVKTLGKYLKSTETQAFDAKRVDLERLLLSHLDAAQKLPQNDVSGSFMEEMGLLENRELPGDTFLKAIAKRIEDKIDRPRMRSIEFMREVAAGVDEYENGSKADQNIQKRIEQDPPNFFRDDIEDQLEKRGFFGTLGASITRGHYKDKGVEQTIPDGMYAMVLGPRVAGRIKAAKKVNPVPIMDELREITSSLYSSVAKRSPYLDVKKNESDREMENLQREHNAEVRSLTGEVGRKLIQVLYDLDQSERDWFTNKMVIDDMAKEIEDTGSFASKIGVGTPELFRENSLRFGFKSPEDVFEAKKKLDYLVEKTSRFANVKEALEKRRRIITPVVTELVRRKHLPAEAMEDPMAFFHRQVMMHHKVRSILGGRTRKPGRISGYLIGRKNAARLTNEEYDHKTNYVESEAEWLVKAMHDIANHKFRESFTERFDATPMLKEKLKMINETEWLGGEAKYQMVMAKRQENRDLTAQKSQLTSRNYKDRKELLMRWLDRNDPARSYLNRKKQAEQAFKREMKLPDDTDQDVVSLMSKIKDSDPTSRAAGYARGWFKAQQEQQRKMMEDLGKRYKTIDDVMRLNKKEDYVKYSNWDAPGGKYGTITTVPKWVADSLEQGVMESYNLTKEDLNKALVVTEGDSIIIPRRMAEQLDYEQRERTHKWALTKAWQAAVLLLPHRLPGYLFVNKLGDTEVSFQATDGSMEGYNRISKFGSDAIKLSNKLKKYLEAVAKYETTGTPIPKEYHEMVEIIQSGIKKGVIGSSLTADQLELHVDMRRFLDNETMSQKMRPDKLIRWYFDKASDIAEYSENINRLAVYMFYRDALQNGKTFSYANSNKEYIDTILKTDGVDAAAAKMAIDLVGNYEQSTPFVEAMSGNIMPFFKFTAINTAREIRITKNNLLQLKNELSRGEFKAGTAVKLSATAMKTVGKIALKLAGPWTMYKLWNWLVFGDEEEKMSNSDRKRNPLILASNPDGTLTFVRGFSTRGDALDLIGGNSFVPLLRMVMAGKIGVDDMLYEMAKDGGNKAVGMLNPLFKSTAEVATGQSYYPDVMTPRSADRGELVAGNIISRETYREGMGAITGDGRTAKPGNFGLFPWLFRTVTTNNNANALNDTYGYMETFLESKGEPKPSFGLSKVRFMRYAAQYNDKESFLKAKKAFIDNGGTDKSFLRSISNVDPVAKLRNDLEKEFTTEFLNPLQVKRMEMGRAYASHTAAAMWKWWAESEKDPITGHLSDKFANNIGSKISVAGPDHRKSSKDSNGVPWSSRYTEAADYLKERDVTLKEALGYLRKYYMGQKNRPSNETINANIRRARVRLIQNRLE